MKRSLLLSVSVLNADFMRLAKSLRSIDAYADSFHVDIMDGTMTPLISFGTWIIPSLKEIVQTPLEIHLYVRNPIELFDEIVEMGVSKILMNYETLSKMSEKVKGIGKAQIGLYLLPLDSPDSIDVSILEHVSIVNVVTVNSLQGGQEISWELVEKVNWLDKIKKETGFQFVISIDGGINEQVLHKVLEYPIDQVIIGSAIFANKNPPVQARKFQSLFKSLQ